MRIAGEVALMIIIIGCHRLIIIIAIAVNNVPVAISLRKVALSLAIGDPAHSLVTKCTFSPPPAW